MYLFTPVLNDEICYTNEKSTFAETALFALQRRFTNNMIDKKDIPSLFGIEKLIPIENKIKNQELELDSLSVIEKKILNIVAVFFAHAKHLEGMIPEIKKNTPSVYSDGDISLLKNWEEKTADELEEIILKSVFAKSDMKETRELFVRSCRYFISIYNNMNEGLKNEDLSSKLKEHSTSLSFLKNTNDFCQELKFYCQQFLTLTGIYEPLSFVDLQSELKNPGLITKESLTKSLKEFSTRFHDKYGVNIRSSKLGDIYAEAIGFKNGFQQLKNQLCPLEYTGIYGENFKKSIEVLDYYFDVKLDPIDHPVSNMHALFKKIKACVHRDDALNIDDLNEFIVSASEAHYAFINYTTSDLKPKERDSVWDEMAEPGYFSSKLFFDEVAFVITRLLSLFQPKNNKSTASRPVEGCKMHVLFAVNSVSKGKFNPETVAELFESGHISDGFEMAMELKDEYGWDLERDDIDICDNIIEVIEKLHRRASWLWLELCSITPTFAVGDHIKQGVITGICEYTAGRYLVKENGQESETRRLLIIFENALSC